MWQNALEKYVAMTDDVRPDQATVKRIKWLMDSLDDSLPLNLMQPAGYGSVSPRC